MLTLLFAAAAIVDQSAVITATATADVTCTSRIIQNRTQTSTALSTGALTAKIIQNRTATSTALSAITTNAPSLLRNRILDSSGSSNVTCSALFLQRRIFICGGQDGLLTGTASIIHRRAFESDATSADVMTALALKTTSIQSAGISDASAVANWLPFGAFEVTSGSSVNLTPTVVMPGTMSTDGTSDSVAMSSEPLFNRTLDATGAASMDVHDVWVVEASPLVSDALSGAVIASNHIVFSRQLAVSGITQATTVNHQIYHRTPTAAGTGSVTATSSYIQKAIGESSAGSGLTLTRSRIVYDRTLSTIPASLSTCTTHQIHARSMAATATSDGDMVYHRIQLPTAVGTSGAQLAPPTMTHHRRIQSVVRSSRAYIGLELISGNKMGISIRL